MIDSDEFATELVTLTVKHVNSGADFQAEHFREVGGLVLGEAYPKVNTFGFWCIKSIVHWIRWSWLKSTIFGWSCFSIRILVSS